MPGTKYTLGSDSTSEFHDITLPSGLTCQARRPGVEGLVVAGLLDSFDELTALVQEKHVAPNTPGGTSKVTPDQTQDAALAFMKDKKKLTGVLQLMDRLTEYVINQPVVWVDYQIKDESDEDWASRQEKAKEDGAFPVRRIDINDKMYLLNWSVGGSSDLSAFRTGTQELLGNMATS